MLNTSTQIAVRYHNLTCDRCGAAKLANTETVWCDACVALPSCQECGTPHIDGRDLDCYECNLATAAEWEEGHEGRCDSIASQRYEEAAYGRPD